MNSKKWSTVRLMRAMSESMRNPSECDRMHIVIVNRETENETFQFPFEISCHQKLSHRSELIWFSTPNQSKTIYFPTGSV